MLEVAWKELIEKLKKANDMDDLISANEEFLNDIYVNLLLDSSPDSQQILSEIRSIFNLIVEITNLNQTFYKIALNEYEARKLHLERLRANDGETIDETLDLNEQERYKNEVKQKLKATRNQLSIYKSSLIVSCN